MHDSQSPRSNTKISKAVTHNSEAPQSLGLGEWRLSSDSEEEDDNNEFNEVTSETLDGEGIDSQAKIKEEEESQGTPVFFKNFSVTSVDPNTYPSSETKKLDPSSLQLPRESMKSKQRSK